jgi:uncharacterized membrane protein (UPF0182 family)
VPLRGDLAFVQSTYAWRPQSAPTIARVAVVQGDSARTARSLAAALGAAAPAASGAAPIAGLSPQGFRARAESLYDSMRDALRRGDWTAFGRAYDALGRLLGRAPR